MACACKANEKIDILYKKYGNKIVPNRKTKIKGNIDLFLKALLLYLIMIVIFPFIFLFVIGSILFKKDKIVDIRKIIKLKFLRNE